MTPKALTVGQIAAELNWPIHRVEYYINSRGIEPEARAGIARVFGPNIIARLRHERRKRHEPDAEDHQ